MSCDQCRELLQPLQIRNSEQLRAVTRMALGCVRRGQLKELPVPDHVTHDQVPLASSQETTTWPDIVVYRFACGCGERFEIWADTYHGSGGHWENIGEEAGT